MKTGIVIIGMSILFCGSLLSSYKSHAQLLPAKYRYKVTQAYQLCENKQYAQSARLYTRLFKKYKNIIRASDFFNAARSWALNGDVDSAFSLLQKASMAGYAGYADLVEDTDITFLKKDIRWNDIQERVRQNQENITKKTDPEIFKEIEQILADDQRYRTHVWDTIEKYGRQSPQMKNITALIRHADSINLVKVKDFLDTRGWIGTEIGGRHASVTIFLVLQHSDSATMVEYQPVLRKAFYDGILPPSYFATFEDRVAMYQKKKQLYGSQTKYNTETKKSEFWPIEDEVHVNKRRAELEMEPMEAYAKRLDIVYKLPSR